MASLELSADDERVTAGHNVDIKIDGHHISEITSLTLFVDPNDAVRAEVEFLVDEMEVELEALVAMIGTLPEADKKSLLTEITIPR